MPDNDSSQTLVIIAVFDVPPAKRDAFLAACAEDARCSVAHEPGCRQFDVLVNEDGSGGVTLFEVYDDAAAFRTHTTMPHYAAFSDAVARLGLPAPEVRRLSRAHRGQA